VVFDARGGSVLRIPDFDLRHPGAKFNLDPSYTTTYETDPNGAGYYRIAVNANG